MLTCIISLAVAFRTMSYISGSHIFTNDVILAANEDMCACTSNRWSKHITIISQTLAFLVFSGSCLRNVHPSGISVMGSVTSTPLVVRCWCRYMQLGSCINFMMTSMLASNIWHQCFTINFFSDVMVDLNASFSVIHQEITECHHDFIYFIMVHLCLCCILGSRIWKSHLDQCQGLLWVPLWMPSCHHTGIYLRKGPH